MKRPATLARDVLASATLSAWQAKRMIPLRDVLAILDEAGVEFVLAGAHAIAPWTGRPRATADVDVVVRPRSHRKAVRAMQKAFPDLRVRDLEVVTRFLDPESLDSLIDLMKPRDDLLRTVFENSVPVELEGRPARIPDREMAAAMKFATMVGGNRSHPDELQDAADFARLVSASPDLDERRLATLCDLVFPGGAQEVRGLVEAVRAGKPLRF